MNYTFDDIKIKKNANQDQEITAATAFLFYYYSFFNREVKLEPLDEKLSTPKNYFTIQTSSATRYVA